MGNDCIEDTTTDFVEIGQNMFSSINWYVVLLLFVFILIINSDTFIKLIISKLSSSFVEPTGELTTKGTIFQSFLIVLVYIILDGARKVKIL